MSWVRIWIHVVFSTKNKAQLIHDNYRKSLFDHIYENAKEKKINILEVNGYKDHVHCLFLLNKELSVSRTIQLIKGESSFWVNKNKLCSVPFLWQDDYWAVGISESHVKPVQKYIKNQEQHHRKKSFQEEIDHFMKDYGWTWHEK